MSVMASYNLARVITVVLFSCDLQRYLWMMRKPAVAPSVCCIGWSAIGSWMPRPPRTRSLTSCCRFVHVMLPRNPLFA
jgi:hypothetical protein